MPHWTLFHLRGLKYLFTKRTINGVSMGRRSMRSIGRSRPILLRDKGSVSRRLNFTQTHCSDLCWNVRVHSFSVAKQKAYSLILKLPYVSLAPIKKKSTLLSAQAHIIWIHQLQVSATIITLSVNASLLNFLFTIKLRLLSVYNTSLQQRP